MGATYGKIMMGNGGQEEEFLPNNGFLFNDIFLPPEVVTLILGFIQPTLSGRLVCKSWRDIIDTSIWREKVLREVRGAKVEIFHHKELQWQDFHYLCSKNPFNRNLLKNGSAEEREILKYWNHAQTERSSIKWIVEREPVGCGPFPPGINACFTASYDWCYADQMISLKHCGLTTNFMKHVRPDIHIEEWYAGRFDCGFEYVLKVTLLSQSWERIDSFCFETINHTTDWAKVEHVFSNYTGEVALIHFHHKGKDTQFWAGNYGCKISGAKVFITLPEEKMKEINYQN